MAYSYFPPLSPLYIPPLYEEFKLTYFCSNRVGGSLGWKTRGSLDPTFEAAAYALEPSTTGNPKCAEVKTGFGYHIIMVEGRR